MLNMNFCLKFGFFWLNLTFLTLVISWTSEFLGLNWVLVGIFIMSLFKMYLHIKFISRLPALKYCYFYLQQYQFQLALSCADPIPDFIFFPLSLSYNRRRNFSSIFFFSSSSSSFLYLKSCLLCKEDYLGIYILIILPIINNLNKL